MNDRGRNVARLALGQMDVKLADPEANLRQVEEWVAEVAPGGAGQESASLLILPELWSTGYDLENAARWAAYNRERVEPRLRELAREHGLYIAGSLLWADGDAVANTFFLHNQQGAAPAVYSKVHLFGLMEEDRYLAAGDHIAVAPVSGTLRVGPGVCYDLRFPEMFRRLTAEGANLLVVVAEWPLPRIEHWRALLKARAIENQVFVAGVNRCGESDGMVFGGCSAVYDPAGTCLVELEGAAGLSILTVDLGEVARFRDAFPAWRDRRPEVY